MSRFSSKIARQAFLNDRAYAALAGSSRLALMARLANKPILPDPYGNFF
jgi:hypothetical protein